MPFLFELGLRTPRKGFYETEETPEPPKWARILSSGDPFSAEELQRIYVRLQARVQARDPIKVRREHYATAPQSL